MKKKTKKNLDLVFMILRKWSHENYMVLNPGICRNIVIADNMIDPTK